MSKKKLKVIGVMLAFAFCFPLHFLYDKLPSFLTSIFAPVNESIWEHMKILFGGIMLSGVVQKIIVTFKKQQINNICFSNFVAAISSIPIFLLIFLPAYEIIGENMVVTIIIMFITILLSQIISYFIMKNDDLGMEKKTIWLVVLVYIIFTILSYYPLKTEIFKDPKTSSYGISD